MSSDWGPAAYRFRPMAAAPPRFTEYCGATLQDPRPLTAAGTWNHVVGRPGETRRRLPEGRRQGAVEALQGRPVTEYEASGDSAWWKARAEASRAAARAREGAK